MEFVQNQLAYVKSRPIAVGLFAIIATLSVGMTFAVATGMTSPDRVMAQILPPCCEPPPPPPPP
ncbi:MAG TPA: hypothetical protein VNU25_02875, partial [Candidatus Paceibacterota bacterium]|nr:hypothetical protein [Candidatus Paceibacterota bacterium]